MHAQQKQADSEGEFESFDAEVQTITPQLTINRVSNPRYQHPRTKQLSEKQKLGLVVVPSLTQPECYQPSLKTVPALNGRIIKVGSATFRSNFESGHIGEVQLIGVNSFRISLDQETNSGRKNIWFYFAVEGIKGQAHFLIKGFSKRSSLYNEGMKLCYRDSKENKWRRGGSLIRYQPYSQDEDQTNYCLKFTYFFKSNEHSSLQFAYSFPYSYQKLNLFISQLRPKVKVTALGMSFEGRTIPLITLGNQNSKDLLIISARVHPGETGSSFIAEGFLKEIVAETPHSKYLLDKFWIKIVPMINVDGVCRGNYRFSAAGVDLNRKWKQPSQQHHPEIFFMKKMIQKESKQRRLRMFIDLHGHSRKKNVFFYGCCRNSQDEDDYSKAKAFPFLMSKLYNAFSYQDCSFTVQKDKQGTARVTLFKEFRINQIFTLQSSFCGIQNGGNFCEADFEKIGKKLCEGISAYFYQPEETHVNALPSKLITLKMKAIKQLENSPELLKVGNDENSGSDSEPQKGQLPEKAEKILENQELSKKRGSNLSTAQTYHRTPKVPSSLKQKSEAAIDRDLKDQQFFKYLLQAPAHLLDTDFKNRQACLKNHRVHSTSKQYGYLKYQKTKVVSFFEENHDTTTLHSEKPSEKQTEKTKIYLLMGREGAQYRRVRKIAEQSLKHDTSLQGEIEVKGIKGSHIEIDHNRMIPKISIPERGKFRRTSAQMFFKKPMPKEEKQELHRNELNVLCRGRQIIF